MSPTIASAPQTPASAGSPAPAWSPRSFQRWRPPPSPLRSPGPLASTRGLRGSRPQTCSRTGDRRVDRYFSVEAAHDEVESLDVDRGATIASPTGRVIRWMAGWCRPTLPGPRRRDRRGGRRIAVGPRCPSERSRPPHVSCGRHLPWPLLTAISLVPPFLSAQTPRPPPPLSWALHLVAATVMIPSPGGRSSDSQAV